MSDISYEFDGNRLRIEVDLDVLGIDSMPKTGNGRQHVLLRSVPKETKFAIGDREARFDIAVYAKAEG